MDVYLWRPEETCWWITTEASVPMGRKRDEYPWTTPEVELRRYRHRARVPQTESVFLRFRTGFPAVHDPTGAVGRALQGVAHLLPLRCPDLADLYAIYVDCVEGALDLDRSETRSIGAHVEKVVRHAFHLEVIRDLLLFRAWEAPAHLYATEAGRALVERFTPSGVEWRLVATE